MSPMGTWAAGSVLRVGMLILFALGLVIQLVPYGRTHSNPPVTRALAFDSPRTKDLFSGACGDCHSNLTSWPVESNIAPASWLIQNDVEGGRARFDVSEWDRSQVDPEEVARVISQGEMPPLQYKLLHPSARLSDAEKVRLASGLAQTFRQDPPVP